MFALTIQKIRENINIMIERSLPGKGNLFVQVGDNLEPFQKLGDCVYSPNRFYFSKGFEPVRFVREKVYFQKGNVLGKFQNKKILAEFNGNLGYDATSDEYFFEDVASKFTLLSGLTGEVKDVVADRSVLISTTVTEIGLAASTDTLRFGEFVVFPNPTEILEKFYLQNYIKTSEGKIVYVGHHVSLEILKKAVDLKIAAVIAGSASIESFNFAKQSDIGLGLISGFGKMETPENVFKILNSIAYRHIFFNGDLGVLRIPMSGRKSSEASSKKTTKNSERAKKETFKLVRKVAKGQSVQVFQKPNFGRTGIIDSISDSSIFVKFGSDLGLVEVSPANFFIIE